MGGGRDAKSLTGDFWLLAAGQGISAFGDSLQKVAVAWLVLEQTHSALATAMVFVVTYIPSIVGTPLGGALADRYDKRKLLFRIDMLRTAIVLVALPVLMTAWAPTAAYVMTLVLSAVTRLYEPGRGALVPATVRTDQLATANAAMGTVLHAQWAIGPAFAGLMVAWLGPIPAIAVNAVTFAVAGMTVLMMRLREVQPPVERAEVFRPLHETRAAAIVTWMNPRLRYCLLMDVLGSLALSPLIGLLPLLASMHAERGAQFYGILNSAVAIGMLVGSAALVWMGSERAGHTGLLPISLLGLGVVTASIGLTRTAPLLLALMALRGMLLTAFNVPLLTMLQRSSRPDMLAKTIAINTLASDAALAVGLALSGAAADVVGVNGVLLAAGGVVVVLAAGGLVLAPASQGAAVGEVRDTGKCEGIE